MKTEVGRKFKKNIEAITGVETKSGATNWSTHTYSLEEREAFADWINGRLKDDPDCQQFLILDFKVFCHKIYYSKPHFLLKLDCYSLTYIIGPAG